MNGRVPCKMWGRLLKPGCLAVIRWSFIVPVTIERGLKRTCLNLIYSTCFNIQPRQACKKPKVRRTYISITSGETGGK